MPTKAKAASTSNDDVKYTRASTSSTEDSKLDQIMLMMETKFASMHAQLVEQSQQIVEL